ncbi:MAG: hypothetical protein JWP97_5648 [Labilithrix sp.]|nr:hypothetical protein [Labilithrix sp.]
MRSVLLTTDTVGGVFTQAACLARELAREGVRVHLATMGDPLREEQRRTLDAIPSLVLHESTYALEWMDDAEADVTRACAWLRGIERTCAPDLVHVNGYALASAGFDAPVVVGAHSCVLSWWEAVLHEPAPARYAGYAAAVAEGLAHASAVIAPSAAMLQALERHHGALGGRGHVVPNGIAPAPAASAPKEQLVLTAGRVWDRAKNIEALVRVAPRLSWPLAVAGWSCEGEALARAALPLGWLGPAALGAWMDRAAIFALPARYEPFGLTPLEAAQRGAALVLGDIPSLREVWGDAAVFVPPDDDDALASAIETLAADADHRAAMSARARQRAARFDARSMGLRTLDIYRNVVREREVAPCA